VGVTYYLFLTHHLFVVAVGEAVLVEVDLPLSVQLVVELDQLIQKKINKQIL
jgi:hypothetical protein